MADSRDGQVVTFYSFKGGTGRTMALANVAWILAANGKRVLVVDWDLESPGLHRFYHPFLPVEVIRGSPGVVDLIREYSRAARNGARRGEEIDAADFARVQQYAVSLDWEFPRPGTLDFMSAGQQNLDYVSSISSLDWDDFYSRLGGGRLFDALRADMKRNYDYVLIDSRTGLSDVASICTLHLPDTLVDCFTMSIQGIEGAAYVALNVSSLRSGNLRVLPVPMRVEDAEKQKADAGRTFARRRFDGFPAGISAQERSDYWRQVEVPYRPYYAHEEILATFGDQFSYPTSLLGAYERLTGWITRGAVTSLPPMDPQLRQNYLARFERRIVPDVTEILLDYEPEDQVWAEWVERVLTEIGISVHLSRDAGRTSGTPVLAIVSPAYRLARDSVAAPNDGDRAHRGDEQMAETRALYVTDMRALDRFASVKSARLAGLAPQDAVQRLIRFVDGEPVATSVRELLARRYPENEPRVNNLPTRNVRFTGRGETLSALRGILRSNTAGSAVSTFGLGGIGKTQLALEYAHRFRSEYDVIWWIQSAQPQFIDLAMVDLALQLNTQFGADIAIGSGALAPEIARETVRTLATGVPVGRWLLIFDNADVLAEVSPFLPTASGVRGGHVLITSRNRAWGDLGATLELNVFTREESIAHLRQQLSEGLISTQEADAIAEELGDLPVAVAAAGVSLSETGIQAADYLHQLRRHTVATLGTALDSFYPGSFTVVWALSLDQLSERSRAAHRLLELCSVLSPSGIAVELVYSAAMVEILAPYDSELSEPGDIARLVNQINRLALLKLDPNTRQLQIHRLLQAVMRERMSAEELDARYHDAHVLLVASRPAGDPDDPSTWRRYEMIWPHLEPSRAEQCDDERVRGLFIDQIRYLYSRGSLAAAERLAVQMETVWHRALGDRPQGVRAATLERQTLVLSYLRANILRERAKYQDAWELDQEVFGRQSQLLGPSHRHTLMTAASLAADLRALGRYGEALELSREAYEHWASEYGGDHPNTLSAAAALALSLRLSGHYAEALALDESTYAMNARIARHHPRTYRLAGAVGRGLRDAGLYEESLTFLRSQHDAYNGILDPASREVGRFRINLAAACRAAGSLSAASTLLASTYDQLVAKFGPNDPDTLDCRMAVAVNRLATREPPDAFDELREVHAAYRDLFGDQHPITLLCAVNFAMAVNVAHSSAEVLPTVLSAARSLKAILGESHPHALAATANLAACLANEGRLAEARDLYAQAAARMSDGSSGFGPGHPDTVRVRVNLLLTRHELGTLGVAEELTQAAAELTALLSDGHPDLKRLMSRSCILLTLETQPT